MAARWGNAVGNSHPQITTTTIDLEAGISYPIRVDYIEDVATEGLAPTTDITGNAANNDPIPAAQLRTCVPVGALSQQALVNHWTLDDQAGTLAMDVVSNSNLDLQGGSGDLAAMSQPAIINDGLFFNGADDQLMNYGYGQVADEDFTITGWFNYNYNDDSIMLSFGNNRIFRLWRNSTGDVFAAWLRSPTNWHKLESTTALTPNRWYHGAISYSAAATELKIYLNGELDGVMVLPEAHTQNNSAQLAIGGNPLGSGQHFGGVLDDFQVYDRVLSAQEIKAIAGPSLTSVAPECATDVNTPHVTSLSRQLWLWVHA